MSGHWITSDLTYLLQCTNAYSVNITQITHELHTALLNVLQFWAAYTLFYYFSMRLEKLDLQED
jgi:hypothetical protein